MNIAIIVGSLRKESLNSRVATMLAALGADEEVLISTVKIDDLPLYNQDDDQVPTPSVESLKTSIDNAEGVIFVTPEYNRSVSGVLKNAIDHASRPYGKSILKGKPAGILGVSVGAIGTAAAQQHLRTILAYLDMPTLGQPEAYLQSILPATVIYSAWV